MTNPQTSAGAPARSTEELKGMLEFQTRLNAMMQRIHEADSLAEVLPDAMPDLRQLLESDKVTIYQRGRNDAEIVSRYKVADGLREIRVPLSSSSIAGYVALNQKVVVIEDVYNDAELQAIHPNLVFNRSFDIEAGYRTRSMIVTPIKYQQVLVGVLQLLNHSDGTPFSKQHVLNALNFAKMLAQKLRYELHSTRGPFDLLVERRHLTREQLDTLSAQAERDKKPLIQLLRDEARILPAEIGASLEHYYQVPYFPFDADIELPQGLIAGLNEAYLRRQLWVPVAGDRARVTILIDNPSDTGRIEEIQRVLKADSYVFKVGLPEDILRFLGQDVGTPSAAANIDELVGRMQDEQRGSAGDSLAAEGDEPEESEATVVQLVNRLVEDAYRSGASDIHVEPERNGAQVRVRVDGICRPLLEIPASHVRAVVSRIKVMARLDITERRKPQDGKLMLRLNGQPLELRVATLPTVHGEEVVMRILAASEPLPLERINLTPANDRMLKQSVAKPHGIFLVVGPTGSGKTTTLHAILGHINTPDRKIWTAEDPVEITQRGLHQLQVQPKIGLTFAAALRAFLRADPDVIMIGEMRDAETVHASIEASLTGHLVFSTLHTNSAAETVVRLLDLGADPINFADALIGILAQRLVRTLCKCKERYTPGEEELFHLRYHYGETYFDELKLDPAKVSLCRPGKCASCNNTGYRGRTGIHELLVATPDVQRLIYTRASATEIRDAAMKEGMRTLRQDGVVKLLQGQIDLTQLLHVVGA